MILIPSTRPPVAARPQAAAARVCSPRMTAPRYTRSDSATDEPARPPAPTPNAPIRSDAIEPERWSEGVRFGGAELRLGDLGGAKQIGVRRSVIAPGKQSCPFHWHLREEEHFYVLSGRCVLRSGETRYPMGPGDYVCFPAGTGVAHCFENPHDEPCALLEIGARDPHEIAVYPDSGKMKLRALERIVPYSEASLDYWAGERPDAPLEER